MVFLYHVYFITIKKEKAREICTLQNVVLFPQIQSFLFYYCDWCHLWAHMYCFTLGDSGLVILLFFPLREVRNRLLAKHVKPYWINLRPRWLRSASRSMAREGPTKHCEDRNGNRVHGGQLCIQPACVFLIPCSSTLWTEVSSSIPSWRNSREELRRWVNMNSC